MFERYTEKARRVIFFARYEASQFGSPNIETEHMLLGLLREDKALTNRFLHDHATVEAVRKEIESNTPIREHVSTSTDLPLSNECKRVLAFAAEEAERLQHRHIGTEHLLLGLLREDKSFAAALLNRHGVRLSEVREALAREPESSEPISSVRSAPMQVAMGIPVLEVVDPGGTVVATVTTYLVPEVGHAITVRDENSSEAKTYTVVSVEYSFEPAAQVSAYGTHRVSKITIQVRA